MKSAIIKRSIELSGHKTSVSLEDEFWNGLRQIAEVQRTPITQVLQSIDAGRGEANLSSAIRVFVLNHFRAAVRQPLSEPSRANATYSETTASSFPC